MNEIEQSVKIMWKMSVGSIFSKLTAVVASPAVQNHHKMVIDRKTIEKTWKYMDKVISSVKLSLFHDFKCML